MNKAAIIMALAEGPPLEFKTTATTAAAAGAVSKPTGLEVGDYVFALSYENVGSVAEGPTTWGSSSIAFAVGGGVEFITLRWKKMATADLGSAWPMDRTQGVLSARYTGHGADAAAVKATQTNGGGAGTVPLAGFSKAAGNYAVLTMMADKTVAAADTAPAGFSSRAAAAPGTIKFSIADLLIGYVDGASAVWGSVGGAASEVGWLVEVTGP